MMIEGFEDCEDIDIQDIQDEKLVEDK